MEEVSRLDIGSFSDLPRTQQGGIIIPASLTRTGVFTYFRSDGAKVRELRHPDEVFRPESLATLKAATVTVGHPNEVNPGNWSSVAKGHVDDVGRKDGNFVASDIRVLDGNTIKAVESKTLQEVSAGYQCKLDMTPGTYNGEAYDGKQVDIRYNHVALLPKGMGRAGPDVRLRLDEASQVIEPAVSLSHNKDQIQMTLDEALRKIGELEANLANAVKRADSVDTLGSQVEVLKGKVTELQTRLDAANDPASLDARVSARVDLVSTARLHLDTKDAPFDAKGKSDHVIRVAVLGKLSPAYKCDGKSEAAVAGAFDMALETSGTARAAMSAVQSGSPANVKVRMDAAPVSSAYMKNIEVGVLAHTVAPPSRIGAK